MVDSITLACRAPGARSDDYLRLSVKQRAGEGRARMTTFLADLALQDFPNVAIVDLRRDEAHVTARMANGVVVEADDVSFAIFSAIVEAQQRESRRRTKNVFRKGESR